MFTECRTGCVRQVRQSGHGISRDPGREGRPEPFRRRAKATAAAPFCRCCRDDWQRMRRNRRATRFYPNTRGKATRIGADSSRRKPPSTGGGTTRRRHCRASPDLFLSSNCPVKDQEPWSAHAVSIRAFPYRLDHFGERSNIHVRRDSDLGGPPVQGEELRLAESDTGEPDMVVESHQLVPKRGLSAIQRFQGLTRVLANPLHKEAPGSTA